MDREHVLTTHQAMAEERQIHEPKWRDIATLFSPDDADWQSDQASTRDNEDLYDGTPQEALETFVDGMFLGAINPAMRWFKLGVLEDPDLEHYGPVKQHLWMTANRIYASLSPGMSSFYANGSAWLRGLGAYGFGAFYSEEDVGRQRIIDTTIPVGESYFRFDRAGVLNRFDRCYTQKGEMLVADFGEQWKGVLTDKRTYKIVHAVMENPKFEPGRLGPSGMPYLSYYCSPDEPKFHREGGYHEFPYHLPIWAKRAKSPYPRGAGHVALADANMLQEMERTHLVAGQFQAEPIILARSEEVVSVADIVPRNVLYGSISESGKQLVQNLEHKGKLQLSMAMSEQRRQAVRNFLFFSMMRMMLDRPQMTATEFLGFQQEDLKRLARHLVTVFGALSGFIARRYRILDRAGQMPPPPPELAERRLEIKYNSPLAMLMEIAEGRAILQASQSIEALALTDPTARDWFNTDGAAPRVIRAFTPVPDVVRDPREVAEIRRQRAEAQQQAIQLEQAGKAVTIAAEASHAEQAASLAEQRGRR